MAEWLWRCGVQLNERRYQRRCAAGDWPQRLPVPVVSVGNITVGGTGKTPTVEVLARQWLRQGGKPGLLSRGYKGGPQGNDEFQLLARRLPGVPHVQEPQRFAGGSELLKAHPEVDLILLDDGFQHRRLHRDLDLVVIDCSNPFGNGSCLPKGILRESWRGLARADAFLLTRGEGASPHKLVILENFLQEHFPRVPRSILRAHYDGVRGPKGVREDLPMGRCFAFAGIGNPTAFFRGLRALDLDVVDTRSFADHHKYSEEDLLQLMRWGEQQQAEAFICTEKDGVKLEQLPRFASTPIPIYQLRLELEVLGPQPLASLRSSRR